MFRFVPHKIIQMKDKVVLITGSSKGIGAAIARNFASKGAKVVINYATNEKDAALLVEEILQMKQKAIAIKADVSKIEEVEELFEKAMAHFGAIDILVNNAGIILYKQIKDTPTEAFERLFQVNVTGVFNTMKVAATSMAENGSIINISSSVARLMLPTYGPYAATKAAVEQLTKVFAKEIGHRGINVNSVSPGPVNTDLFHEGKTPEQIAHLSKMSAFNRIGETEDIAKVIAFLATDEAKWITAQNIGANGGFA